MAITRNIEIDGVEVPFRASAAVPRLYRMKFGRDIYKDLAYSHSSWNEKMHGLISVSSITALFKKQVIFVILKQK